MITRLPLTFIELNEGLFNTLLCRYNNDFMACLTIDPCQHPAKHSIFNGYTPVFIFQCLSSVHHPTDSLKLQSSHFGIVPYNGKESSFLARFMPPQRVQ